MKKRTLVDEVLSQAPNRRRILTKMAAAATIAGSAVRLKGDPSNPTPEEVVQFALNLEYLEAEFYSIATTGKTLQERGYEIWGVGEPGNAPGPTYMRFGRVDFRDRRSHLEHVAYDLAADESAMCRS